MIISGRYFQEREAGDPGGCAPPDPWRTGLASRPPALRRRRIRGAGSSDVAMLRDFGLIAVIDLGVALAGVALVLPAMLVWLSAVEGSREEALQLMTLVGVIFWWSRSRSSNMLKPPTRARSGSGRVGSVTGRLPSPPLAMSGPRRDANIDGRGLLG